MPYLLHEGYFNSLWIINIVCSLPFLRFISQPCPAWRRSEVLRFWSIIDRASFMASFWNITGNSRSLQSFNWNNENNIHIGIWEFNYLRDVTYSMHLEIPNILMNALQTARAVSMGLGQGPWKAWKSVWLYPQHLASTAKYICCYHCSQNQYYLIIKVVRTYSDGLPSFCTV